jgi:hypothetical protein
MEYARASLKSSTVSLEGMESGTTYATASSCMTCSFFSPIRIVGIHCWWVGSLIHPSGMFESDELEKSRFDIMNCRCTFVSHIGHMQSYQLATVS